MKKRTLEKMADKIEVERIKLLFGIDAAHKELQELSPGKTMGEDGLSLALFIDESVAAANALAVAWEHLDRLVHSG